MISWYQQLFILLFLLFLLLTTAFIFRSASASGQVICEGRGGKGQGNIQPRGLPSPHVESLFHEVLMLDEKALHFRRSLFLLKVFVTMSVLLQEQGEKMDNQCYIVFCSILCFSLLSLSREMQRSSQPEDWALQFLSLQFYTNGRKSIEHSETYFSVNTYRIVLSAVYYKWKNSLFIFFRYRKSTFSANVCQILMSLSFVMTKYFF